MTLQNSISILQHNVCTWNNKKYELYNTYRHINPDIILINDHGLCDGKEIKLQNYVTYTCNRQNTLHKGTAIAIKQNIEHIINNFETDLIAVTVQTRQGPITIATDYIPPNSYMHGPDYQSLISYTHPVYLIADLNARHQILGTSNNNTVGKNLYRYISVGKLQHIGPNFPTFITNRSSTKPDIVLGNKEIFHNILLEPGPVTSSDHIPIVAKITANPILIPIQPRIQIAKANWSGYANELSQHEIPHLENVTTAEIDAQLDSWTNKVQEASRKHIPTIDFRITPGTKPTDDVIALQQQHELTYEAIRQHGPTQDRFKQLQDLRNAISTEYRILYYQTWNKIISEIDAETDSKTFWSSIKRYSGNKKKSIPYIHDHHNNKLHSEIDKEQHFRNHWKTIFQNEDCNSDFDQENLNTVENYISNEAQHTIPFTHSDINKLNPYFPPISMAELTETINHRKQKAPGPTGLTAAHLKNLPENMLKFLLNIYNACLSIGYFPNKLKLAIMIFIPKGSSSQHQVQNYRPISLLDSHGKILDNILNKRLTHFLEQNNKNNPRQHGFRAHRGTHTALATFYESLSNNVQNDTVTDIVLRDVAKAFDKVWHNGLKYKLHSLKLHPCFTKILCSFITNRTACIRLQHHTGPAFPLLSGVPQGACLSPTLYNFYTHDTPDPLHQHDYIAYADDITQIVSFDCNKANKNRFRRIANQTESAISHINNFENKWKIKTNTNKFTIVPIHRNKHHQITVNNNPLQYTREGTVLGLTFGRYSIIPQVRKRKNLASSALTMLNRFRQLNPKNKLKLYKALVLPSLIYPAVPFNTLSKTQFRQLQTTQNRALRFVTNTKFTEFVTSKALHDRLKIDPINVTIHRQAQKTWNTMKTHLPATYNKLVENYNPTRLKPRYQSSRTQAENEPPNPIY